MIRFVSLLFAAPKTLATAHARISSEIEKLQTDCNELAQQVHTLKADSAKGFKVSSAHDVQQKRWQHLEREIAIRHECIEYLEGPHKQHAAALSEEAIKKIPEIETELRTGFQRMGFTVDPDAEDCIPTTFFRYHPRYRQAVAEADSAVDLAGRISDLVNEHHVAIGQAESRMETFRNKTLQLA